MEQFFSSKRLYVGSVAFRQHRAPSHCHFIHGYGVHVKFLWGAIELDRLNWVVDYGATKELKTFLEETFDHKYVVAKDDPHLDWFLEGKEIGVLDLVVVDQLSTELFAKMAFDASEAWLQKKDLSPRVWTEQVELSENEYNSAIVRRVPQSMCGGSCGCQGSVGRYEGSIDTNLSYYPPNIMGKHWNG